MCLRENKQYNILYVTDERETERERAINGRVNGKTTAWRNPSNASVNESLKIKSTPMRCARRRLVNEWCLKKKKKRRKKNRIRNDPSDEDDGWLAVLISWCSGMRNNDNIKKNIIIAVRTAQ